MLENSKEQTSIANPQSKSEFLEYYKRIRQDTENLCKPLEKEDYMIQAMTEASPTKWHISHVSWFYEAFILKKFDTSYKPLNELYDYMFNSYYQDIGKPWPRNQRSHISRPTVDESYEFRTFIDEKMLNVIDSIDNPGLNSLNILGGNHEQQHQELILTDIKYNLSINPLKPAYDKSLRKPNSDSNKLPDMKFLEFNGGLTEIGYTGNGFAFDNEMPVNKQYLRPYKLANRLVTNGEFIEFIEQGGYQDHRYWLSEGWDQVRQNNWVSPLHWYKIEDEWYQYTLGGMKKLILNEPVTHVSFFEVDAYAKFKQKRLPSEAEWENAVKSSKLKPGGGNFRESKYFHPNSLTYEEASSNQLLQMFGDVWEWTSSAYLPYPGFSVLAEGISEYNGKFMSSQFVLKGGSCVTPVDHIRASYRNFWHPRTRFQFSGFRLAE